MEILIALGIIVYSAILLRIGFFLGERSVVFTIWKLVKYDLIDSFITTLRGIE